MEGLSNSLSVGDGNDGGEGVGGQLTVSKETGRSVLNLETRDDRTCMQETVEMEE